METTFSYTGGDMAFFSSDEKKWINRIRRLKQQFPDDVEILAQPENNDGCIYAKLPKESMKINLISHRELSDEERAVLAERLRNNLKNAEKNGRTE